MNSASRKFAAQNAAAIHPGPVLPRYFNPTPLMAGPKINPSPNAMPINPILRDRSAGGVMSAMYAWATVIFAPQIPAKLRKRSNIQRATLWLDIPEAMAKSA